MKTKPLLIILILLSIVLVFRPFLSNLPLVWGDAPYFYPDTFKFLFNENFVWTTRGIALGGINQLMWLYPIMFLYGAIHALSGLNNDLIIRILLYFPSLVLAVISPLIFVRKLKLDTKIGLIASILYVFNTYYLLVVDGGQVGIALAYGLFPLVLIHLIELINKPKRNNFWMSMILSFLMCLIDPRFFIVAVIMLGLWIAVQWLLYRKLPQKRFFYKLFLLVFALVGLNSYWLVPTLSAGVTAITAQSSGLQLVSLLNTLTLFQPHWPTNIFGQVSYPPFYFAIVPILVFFGLFLKKNKKIFLLFVLFLISAFIAKGDTPPFGELYSFAVSLPFGVALRDSTKFWPPLILFAGVLIGYTFVEFEKKFKQFALLIPILMLIFVHQALLGNLNFVLSSREADKDLLKVNNFLSDIDGQFRVAWIPERYPITYDSWDKQSLDAKDLVNLRPLANLNGGDYDRFNYMYNESFVDWYRLFGIKYTVLLGDPRIVQLNEQQKKDWDNLNSLVSTSSALIKNEGLKIPVYEVKDIKPRIIASDKAIIALGGQEKMSANIPMVFPEDGLFDPKELQAIASDSASLYFDNKDKTDLQMSFLQDNFISPQKNSRSDWSVWASDDYLKWKYQALIRGVDTKELDYNRGIAFSEKPEEEISFDVKAKTGSYILAVRSLSRSDNDQLIIDLDGTKFEVSNKRRNFEWFTAPFRITSDNTNMKVVNNSGFWMLNTIALIPEKDFNEARNLAEVYMNHFPVLTDLEFDNLIQNSNWSDVSFSMINPTKYEVESDKPWLMLTDNYNKNWEIDTGRSALPFYSAVNGFYKDPKAQSIQIYFSLQEKSRWGLYLSALSGLATIIIFIYSLTKDEE